MNNLYIKFSLLIFCLCLLSDSVLAMNGNDVASNLSYPLCIDGGNYVGNTPVGYLKKKVSKKPGNKKQPTITGFDPKRACEKSSISITIIGTNLAKVKEVKIGGRIAAIESNTLNRIIVKLPNNARTGKIRVTTKDGTTQSPGSFIVNPLPDISNLDFSVSSPVCLNTAPDITITGLLESTNYTISYSDNGTSKIQDIRTNRFGNGILPVDAITDDAAYNIKSVAFNDGISNCESNPAPSLPDKSVLIDKAVPVIYFNYALNKNAKQSTDYSGRGGDASNAIDGNTNGAWNFDNIINNSVTHTSNEFEAWWQVDLGESRSVDYINVYRRTDCCKERLVNFYVLLSNNKLERLTLADALIDPNVESHYVEGDPGDLKRILTSGNTARYVKIQLSGKAFLSLAEVEVMGSDPEDIEHDANPGKCSTMANWSTPVALSNCGPVTINSTHKSGEVFSVGTTSVTYTATDVSGNTNDCSFDITVNDIENPVAICKNITVQLDINGAASITPDMIDDGSTDNCEIAEITLDKLELSSIGDNTVKLTVTDKSGNYSSCDAIVSVAEMPKLSLSPVSIDEGAGVAVVKAILNKVSSKDISFKWCVDDDISAGNSATKGDDYDGVGWTTVTIPAGESSVDLKISIYEDSQYEGDEVFVVFFNSAVNATSVGDRVICTIVDNDDPLPSLSISDISVDEGAGVAVFEARLNELSSKDVSFKWLTIDNTAFEPGDYKKKNWTDALIPAGQLSVDLEVTIVDDTEYEPGPDEKFICDIAYASNASITKRRGYCEIVDNENTASIEINIQDVSIGSSADDLVHNVLVTGCLTADGVTFVGDEANGLGYFSKGDSDFPLSSGVMMSTGKVNNAEGPASNFESDYNNGFDFDENNQDSDLRILAGTTPKFNDLGNVVGWDKPYYDAQVLEFDFIPAGNKLEFNYIFASEEYNGFACSNFNDGFAFILSGPGITNDIGLSGQNIALTENGDQVSINNVYKNQCEDCPDNSEYYVEEIGGHSIAFDGRTKILTAKADVTSCETYHIKLIVYDRNDKGYNSAVFLEAKSFKSNEVIVENRIDGIDGDKEVMYRGCDKSYISFTRKEGIDKEYPFHITIGGTAQNGIDYYQVTEDGTKIGDFPEDVSFAKGQSEIKIFYMASDEVSGSKDILFEVLRGCPCSTDENDYFKKRIDIIDIARIEAEAISNVTCNGGDPVSTIIIKLAGELDPTDYLYAIDSGDFQEGNKFQGAYSVGDHTVTIKDKFSCGSEVIPIIISEATDLKANAGVDFEMCEKESTKTLNGTGGIDYLWTCDKPDGLEDVDVTSPSPSISPNLIAGDYTYTLTVSDGLSGLCESSAEVVVTVKPTPVIKNIDAYKLEVCSGQEINLTASVGNVKIPSYKWTPDTEIEGASEGLNVTVQPTSLVLAPRTFTFTVTEDICSASKSISGIKVYPNPKISLIDATSNLCADGSSGELHIEATGGTPNSSAPLYNYEWSHNSTLNSPNALSLPAGDYQVKVSDVKACFSEADFTVNPKPQPRGIFHD